MGLKESLSKLTMVALKRGEVLFREGIPSNGAMFFLFEGQLDVYKSIDGKQAKMRSILPGEFFGEMAIINNSPRAASIVIVSEMAKLGIINRDTFVNMSKESPDFLFLLLKRVIERLHETDSKIRVLKRGQDDPLSDSKISMPKQTPTDDADPESMAMIPVEGVEPDS